MGHFRFRFVLKISRYIIHQPEPWIAVIKVNWGYFKYRIWGHLRSKSKDFQTRQIYRNKGLDIKLDDIKLDLEITKEVVPGVTRGHLTLNRVYLGSSRVKI